MSSGQQGKWVSWTPQECKLSPQAESGGLGTRRGQQARGLGEAGPGAVSYSRRGQPYWSAWSSADWTRPTTPGRGLCFTQGTNLNVNLNWKHPPGHTQNHLAKYLGTPWPSQVDT